MAKAKATHYRVLRTDRVVRGDAVYDLTAGEVRDDIPDDLAEILGGDHGAIEPVEDADG